MPTHPSPCTALGVSMMSSHRAVPTRTAMTGTHLEFDESCRTLERRRSGSSASMFESL